MTKLEAVDDIRKALLELILVKDSVADDDEATRLFQSSFERLVDLFYQETHDILAYQQYKAARSDPGYFAQLIMVAYRYYEEESAGKVIH